MGSRFDSPWLNTALERPGAKVRLFCLPYGGAGASVFRGWSELFDADVEICAIQLPGREERIAEPLVVRVAPLVEAIANALQPHLTKPFGFFGHSNGAILGFELARLLRDRGWAEPSRIFVSGCNAPHVPEPQPWVHRMSQEDFISKLRELDGVPAEIFDNEEIFELVSPIIRADYEVHETYEHEPRPPLSCPVTVFGGREDATVDASSLETWSHHTASAVDVRTFSGGHFFLNDHLDAICTTIRKQLISEVNESQPTWDKPPRFY